jgi:hypothetical protein
MVLVLDHRTAELELAHGHDCALQEVQRLKAGHHDRDVKF